MRYKRSVESSRHFFRRLTIASTAREGLPEAVTSRNRANWGGHRHDVAQWVTPRPSRPMISKVLRIPKL